MEDKQYNIKINKQTFKGFMIGVLIAAPIFIGGTYLFSGNNTNANPNANLGNNEPQNEEQTEPQFAIDEKSHTLGDKNADVQIVLYDDFQCPYCERHNGTIKQIVEEYGDDIYLVFKHFPLSFHESAIPAAEAAECAGEQGKFWEYADELFANQDKFSSEPWVEFASKLGLNVNDFQTCIDGNNYQNIISSDLQEGINNGVEGTPATFVNGQLVSGALPFTTFKQIIDSLLK